jgi:hypothetical protein
LKLRREHNLLNLMRRIARRIYGAHHRAHARANDVVYRNAIGLELLQYANVRETFCTATAQYYPHFLRPQCQPTT